jgi:AcrR family transcriptional regulator/DNA-binding MarR family transcriptional regulator
VALIERGVRRRPGGPFRDRSELRRVQRARLVTAMMGAAEVHGYTDLTLAEVLARARISRKTFYEVFDDLEDCFLAAFEHVVAHTRERVHAAYRSERDWRRGTRAALLELLTMMEHEHGLARVCVVDTLIAGPRVLEFRLRVLRELAQAVDGGRAVANARHDPHPLTGEAIAGGVATLLHSSLLREDPAPLTVLHGALMSMLVMPYLGRAAAHKELHATTSARVGANGRAVLTERAFGPLTDLNMRLTYRTVRVLSAIAKTPDATNVQIADAAGIVDQGQISKLLARLTRLGLVENARPERSGRGENAWRLTERGALVEHSTNGQM